MLNAKQFEALIDTVSNWGRWGKTDELGTLNLIHPTKIRDAARLVQSGRIVSLALPTATPIRNHESAATHRFKPIHTMLRTGSDTFMTDDDGFAYADGMITMALHWGTHWDALAHIFYHRLMYNNQSAAQVSSMGASVNDIAAVSPHIATRGVLVDVAAYHGEHALPAGYAITVADLDGALAAQRVTVGSGDALLVRTGLIRRNQDADHWARLLGPTPGLSIQTAGWLRENDIAALATDTARVEVSPSEVDGVSTPFHVLAITYMGMLLGEMFLLDELAHVCKLERRYEFFFVAPPLPITGGVGSPANPYALF